ncbi:MAG TPA: DUF2130 domain-containing protein [Dehalococcoidia bacterium]|nr:DUF2130 domain-containing protein [Dehalococcoidia bacterium]
MATRQSLTACPYCGQAIGAEQRVRIEKVEAEHLALAVSEQAAASEKRIADLQEALKEEREIAATKLAAEIARVEEAKDAEVAARVSSLIEARTTDMEKRLSALSDIVKEKEDQLSRAQKTNETLQRQLDEKPAYTRGGMQEEDLVAKLRAAFPKDRIGRVAKRSGADIEHEVIHDGSSCGVILYESKNVQNWNSDFIDKLIQDKVDRGAAHAVLVTTAFPAKARDFDVIKGVPIVRPELLVSLVAILRQGLVDLESQALSKKDRGSKLEHLVIYLSSPDFKNKMQNVLQAVADLEELQTKERRAHDRHWEEEKKLQKTILNSSTDVQSDVVGILAGRT